MDSLPAGAETGAARSGRRLRQIDPLVPGAYASAAAFRASVRSVRSQATPQVLPAHVAVGRQRAVDRRPQVQIPDDGRGPQVEHPADGGLQPVVAHGAGAEGVHQHAHRLGHADGVGQLHLAAPGQAGGHDVLGHIPGGVGRGAVHLGGVLAGEAAAAVGGAAAVGVHDDLAAGEAGVPLGAADDEAACWVDIILRALIQQLRRGHGLDDLADHVLPDLVQADLRAVLGGDDHRVHPDGAVVLVVLHRHLALAVGPHIGELSALADLRHPAAELVGQGDGQGHQLRRLVAGVAEHHALVAGAVAQLAVGALLVLQGLVHPQGDVGGLLVDVGDDAAGVAVKAVLGPVVADVPGSPPGRSWGCPRSSWC